MADNSALQIWNRVVPEEWIDYNGHLNEGYYGVAFGEASDELLVHIGFGPDYLRDIGTFYTVETHIRFLQEVHQGSTISCRSILAGADEKRLHVHHDLLVGDDPTAVATQEVMMLHVQHSTGEPKTAPMVDPVLTKALELAAAHRDVERPAHLGGGVRQLKAG